MNANRSIQVRYTKYWTGGTTYDAGYDAAIDLARLDGFADFSSELNDIDKSNELIVVNNTVSKNLIYLGVHIMGPRPPF